MRKYMKGRVAVYQGNVEKHLRKSGELIEDRKFLL